ncbi:hypothetical protein LUZ62_015485 [Rhynchospora pubera]|uniref:LysM domain-containing protein n=1 Tax=Rhynchospora pubera TaxID=906938 RepID=A0AAV8GD28_9POAL|nr:hypothetical protein LUZ62_015485 [Rhynchospora pubera]
MKSTPYTTSGLLLLFLLSCLAAVSEAATFTCNATATATCQSIINFKFANASTYGNISSLFQVPLASILGANNLPYTTSSTGTVPGNTTVKIPVPCRCTNGVGRSDQIPVYIVQSGDDLDAIARYKFDQFINYTEIGNVNNISDTSLIQIGQKLWIPLPCSCDPVEEKKVMHLAYQVASGNSVAGIAAMYGTTESTLLKLNGISDPKLLQAEQILDVPLQVCESSINDTSLDHGLLLSSGTYAYTANDCVKCSCNLNSSSMLDCSLASNRNRTCPAATCSGNLTLGESSGTGCGATTCAYSGYTNITSLNILTTSVTNQSTSCNSAATKRTGPAASAWMKLIVSLHLILISICFL